MRSGCKYGFSRQPNRLICARMVYTPGQQPGSFRKAFGSIFPYTTTERATDKPKESKPTQRHLHSGFPDMGFGTSGGSKPDGGNATDEAVPFNGDGEGGERHPNDANMVGQWAVSGNDKKGMDWSLEIEPPSTKQPKKRKPPSNKPGRSN